MNQSESPQGGALVTVSANATTDNCCEVPRNCFCDQAPKTSFATCALEWSKTSNDFHVQEVDRSTASNMAAFKDDRATKYVVIAIGTRDDMLALADELRPILEYRNAQRGEG